MTRRGIEQLFNKFEQSVMGMQDLNKVNSILDSFISKGEDLEKVILQMPVGSSFTAAEYNEHFRAKTPMVYDSNDVRLVAREFYDESFNELWLLLGDNSCIPNEDKSLYLMSSCRMVDNKLEQMLVIQDDEGDVIAYHVI